MTADPRAALAEAAYLDNPGPNLDDVMRRLAERGVLLVTEERLAAALYDLRPWMQRTDAAESAAAIFAALSGEATE